MAVIRIRRLLRSAVATTCLLVMAGCRSEAAPPRPTATPVRTATSVSASSATARPSSATPRPGPSRPPSVAVVAPDACTPDCLTFRRPSPLPATVAPGASGLVVAAVPGVFWTVDDARGTSELVAVTATGQLVARVAVRGMSARNAEALAAAPCRDTAGRCLFVADIGDNLARRASVTVYRLEEPALQPLSHSAAAQAWVYRYPDGPHNAEALLPTPDGSLLIITKTPPADTTGKTAAHRIYRAEPGGGTLVFVRAFTPPDPTDRLQSLLTGTVVTDAAYDGHRVLLLTYDEVVAYTAPTENTDPAGFPGWPHRELPHPAMIQTEGVASLSDGCGFAVVSEAGPAGGQSSLAIARC